MKKRVLNIIKILLIIIIVLVCVVSLVQNEFLDGKEFFGYRGYIVENNNSNPNLEKDDVILAKEIETKKIVKNDILVFINNDKITFGKVIENNNEIVKIKESNSLAVYEISNKEIEGKYEKKSVVLSLLNKVLGNKKVFTICILIPFFILVSLELLEVIKRFKKTSSEEKMLMENNDDLDLNQNIELIVDESFEGLDDSKKNNEFEQTIQIPLEEIKEQINTLGASKVNKDDIKEDTMVLFTKEDIKEIIRQELEKKESFDNSIRE